jgi:hypothetical protein
MMCCQGKVQIARHSSVSHMSCSKPHVPRLPSFLASKSVIFSLVHCESIHRPRIFFFMPSFPSSLSLPRPPSSLLLLLCPSLPVLLCLILTSDHKESFAYWHQGEPREICSYPLLLTSGCSEPSVSRKLLRTPRFITNCNRAFQANTHSGTPFQPKTLVNEVLLL